MTHGPNTPHSHLKLVIFLFMMLFTIDAAGQAGNLSRQIALKLQSADLRQEAATGNYGITPIDDSLKWTYTQPRFTVRRDCTLVNASPLRIERKEYESIQAKFHYQGLKAVPDQFGALTPQLPMVQGYHNRQGLTDRKHKIRCKSCIAVTGWLVEQCWSLVVKTPRGYRMLDRRRAQRFFAPIESDEEAIGYLCLMENVVPIYDFSFLGRLYKEKSGSVYKVLQPQLRPTLVEPQKDGYLVNMFDTSQSEHYIEIIYKVSFNGAIEVIDALLLYTVPTDSVLD